MMQLDNCHLLGIVTFLEPLSTSNSRLLLSLYHFFSGGMFLAGITICLLFWGFFRRTGDRFFALFSAAFLILALNRVAIILFTQQPEDTAAMFYMVRFSAYLLIIIAIIDKNRAGRLRSES